MGLMTGADFRDELILALENRSDAAVSSTNLLRWINQAYFHMTYPSVHAFEAFRAVRPITLVQDQWEYSTVGFGYNVLAIRTVFHVESILDVYTAQRSRLKPRDIRWFEGRQHSTGPPRFYNAGEGQTIRISPVPSATEAGQLLRVRLWREATAILDGTTTEVPSYFDQVLLLGAQAIAEYRLGYRDRARETLEHYAAMLNDPKQKDEIEGEDWGFEAQLVGEPIMGVSQ